LPRLEIAKLALIGGVIAIPVVASLATPEVADEPEPVFELLGGSELPNWIVDDLMEIGSDVLIFLGRMVPGI
jgi:hypothetical protein